MPRGSVDEHVMKNTKAVGFEPAQPVHVLDLENKQSIQIESCQSCSDLCLALNELLTAEVDIGSWHDIWLRERRTIPGESRLATMATLEQLSAAAVRYRIAVGPQVGRKTMTLRSPGAMAHPG